MMHETFAFVDGSRTFSCCVETMRGPRAEEWWWFRVSTDENQRYAPFRAEPDDTTDGYDAVLLAKLLVVAASGLTAYLHTRATTPRGRGVYGGLTALTALTALLLGVLLAG